MTITFQGKSNKLESLREVDVDKFFNILKGNVQHLKTFLEGTTSIVLSGSGRERILNCKLDYVSITTCTKAEAGTNDAVKNEKVNDYFNVKLIQTDKLGRSLLPAKEVAARLSSCV